jgi:cytochrome c oxidase assembly factor CtaG/putative copper export protein
MSSHSASTSSSRLPRAPRGAATLLVGLPALALATVVVVELVTGTAPRSTPGLRDAGPVVEWLVPLTRTCWDLATFAVVGCLVAAGWLVPAGPDGLTSAGRRLLRLAGRWSLLWAASAAILTVVSTAQLVGTGVRDVLTSTTLHGVLWNVPQNRALLIVALVGLAVRWCSSRLRRPDAVLLLLAAALLALVPVLVAGHAGTASNHYLAAQSLVVHVLAASLWVGGLAALVLHLRGDLPLLQVVLPRFSTLALCSFVAVALSGALGSWVRLGLSWEAWHSAYGALVAAKIVSLVVLGALGAAHRAWTLPRVADGRRYAFLRLAAGELLVMATAAALAVVLSRTPAPVSALTRAAPPHANTFPTVDRGIAPVGPRTLLLQARPDALVLTVAAVLLAGYLLAVVRTVRGGGTWQTRRTVLFTSGVLLAAWSLCGGLGAYSGALLSADVARLLTMGLLVPALLTCGAPVVTARLGRRLDPVNGLVLLVLLLAGTLMTPLLEASLRSPLLHLGIAVAALAAGSMFLWPLLAADRLPAQGRDSGLLLSVLAVLLLVYAAHIYTSSTLFAGEWFSGLGLWWGDAAADQQRAAFVAAGFAVAALLGAQALGRRRTRPAQPAAGSAMHAVPTLTNPTRS